MRANGVVLLDSYRLSQYAESAPCYICDEGNNFDAELCRHCQAPMALAHQAASQKILPKMIVAGFATVTITSVIVTSIIAGRIGG